ncbi:hypothetical protein ACFV9B_41845, partial [Kitasatospora purpeofusca]
MTTDESGGRSTGKSAGEGRDAGSSLPLRVAVIIGSTREGRIGDAVGRWFMERARDRSEGRPAPARRRPLAKARARTRAGAP